MLKSMRKSKSRYFYHIFVHRYMLREVWHALNCLFIHAPFCVIATGASPGQTKNEGPVRKNDDLLQLWFE